MAKARKTAKRKTCRTAKNKLVCCAKKCKGKPGFKSCRKACLKTAKKAKRSKKK